MEDKPISIRLGARRLEALERYLSENEGETRNGVIAGAVEEYLRSAEYSFDLNCSTVAFAVFLGLHGGQSKSKTFPGLTISF